MQTLSFSFHIILAAENIVRLDEHAIWARSAYTGAPHYLGKRAISLVISHEIAYFKSKGSLTPFLHSVKYLAIATIYG